MVEHAFPARDDGLLLALLDVFPAQLIELQPERRMRIHAAAQRLQIVIFLAARGDDAAHEHLEVQLVLLREQQALAVVLHDVCKADVPGNREEREILLPAVLEYGVRDVLLRQILADVEDEAARAVAHELLDERLQPPSRRSHMSPVVMTSSPPRRNLTVSMSSQSCTHEHSRVSPESPVSLWI